MARPRRRGSESSEPSNTYSQRHWHRQHMRSAFHALERTRTAMPFGTTPSRWRVYQFHHQGKTTAICEELVAGCSPPAPSSLHTGPTGLEPATSRVTVECSNQTELRPQLRSQGPKPLPN